LPQGQKCVIYVSKSVLLPGERGGEWKENKWQNGIKQRPFEGDTINGNSA